MLNETKTVELSYVRIYDRGEFMISFAFQKTPAENIVNALLDIKKCETSLVLRDGKYHVGD